MIVPVKGNYVVFVALTKGRQILCVAGFNREQAGITDELLGQSPQDIQMTGIGLKNLIFDLKRTKKWFGAVINVATKTPGGLHKRPSVPLTGRQAELISQAILSQNHVGIAVLRQNLKRIQAGLVPHGTILKPFLYSEGFIPQGTSKLVLGGK